MSSLRTWQFFLWTFFVEILHANQKLQHIHFQKTYSLCAFSTLTCTACNNSDYSSLLDYAKRQIVNVCKKIVEANKPSQRAQWNWDITNWSGRYVLFMGVVSRIVEVLLIIPPTTLIPSMLNMTRKITSANLGSGRYPVALHSQEISQINPLLGCSGKTIQIVGRCRLKK